MCVNVIALFEVYEKGKTMKQKILIIVLAVVVIITGSCKDDGTGPGKEIKNPREFTWTADTIYYPDSYQTIIVST